LIKINFNLFLLLTIDGYISFETNARGINTWVHQSFLAIVLLSRVIDSSSVVLILACRLIIEYSGILVVHDFYLCQVEFQLLPFLFIEATLYQFYVDDTRNHNDDNISHYVSTKSHYLEVYEEMDNVFSVKEMQAVDISVCDMLDCGIQNQALVLQNGVEK